MFFPRVMQSARLWLPPFRRSIGRIGMWLVKRGESLQRKYAGWNHAFRLQHTVLSDYEADFWVSEPLIEVQTLSFYALSDQVEKRPRFVETLLKTRGVCSVVVYRYLVRVRWSKVFTWQEMVPTIDGVLIREIPVS